jgi:tetratricopeptide (TPR) repeat protein
MYSNVVLLSVLALVLVASGCGDSVVLRRAPVGGQATDDGVQPPANSAKEELPGKDNSHVYLTKEVARGLEDGDGVEYREMLVNATNLQLQRQDAAALRVLDEIVGAFEKKMTDPSVAYVSVANRAELTKYQLEQPGKSVRWLDYSFGDALHQKTLLAVTRRDFPEALRLSTRELSFRPYAAVAYTEHGFILNSLGKPADGLRAYTKALQLSENFDSNRGVKAAALRGIGFTQIDLGDYEAARNALNQSLQVEPNNEIALGELEYIRGMEAKAKKK